MRLGFKSAVVVCAIAIATAPAKAFADVRLPAIISDHMVLQSGVAVPIWGWADAGQEVTVEIAGQKKTATADAQGAWRVRLDAIAAGGPHVLMVRPSGSDAKALEVQDVLVGEVWLASGQSNMAMTVDRCNDAASEKAAAEYPKLRMFKVATDPTDKPKADCKGQWLVCSPKTAGGFSATAYYFGRELHKTLDAPVGLINTSVGGTPIEAWTSWDAQEKEPKLASLLARSRKSVRWPRTASPFTPRVCPLE